MKTKTENFTFLKHRYGSKYFSSVKFQRLFQFSTDNGTQFFYQINKSKTSETLRHLKTPTRLQPLENKNGRGTDFVLPEWSRKKKTLKIFYTSILLESDFRFHQRFVSLFKDSLRPRQLTSNPMNVLQLKPEPDPAKEHKRNTFFFRSEFTKKHHNSKLRFERDFDMFHRY